MIKLALLIFVAILLAACQPAATGIPPTPSPDPLVEQISGKYLITVTQDDSAASPGIEAGDYSLKLQSDLRWFITDPSDPGWIATQGYYTVKTDHIVFKTTGGAMAAECVDKSGTYQWSLVGQSLTFTLVSDDCPGGKFLLPLHPFIKQP